MKAFAQNPPLSSSAWAVPGYCSLASSTSV